MRKLLRKQDILLLGLTGLLDIFDEFRDPGGLVGKSYENMYGFMPSRFKKRNYKHLVWRNLKTNYIEKVIKNGEVFLRLTSNGKDKINREFPLISLQKKNWDKKWRLVLFDIQEINKLRRDSLRIKLKELGFGMLQKSVFITPHDFAADMIEFLKSSGLLDSVFVIEILSSSILTGDIEKIADNVWNLEKLNSGYQEIIDDLNKLTESKNEGLISLRDREKELNLQNKKERGKKKRKNIIENIKQKYFQILLEDPFLPKELLPEGWLREKAGRMLKEY